MAGNAGRINQIRFQNPVCWSSTGVRGQNCIRPTDRPCLGDIIRSEVSARPLLGTEKHVLKPFRPF